MQVHFDSSRVADRDNFASYSALTDRLMYPAARSTRARQPEGRMRLASADIAGLLLLELIRPPGRSARSLRHGRVDACFVSVLGAGPVVLDTGGYRTVQNVGDVIVWHADQPHEWRYEHGMSSICVRLPLNWTRIAGADGWRPRVLAGSSPLGILAASLVRQIAALPQPRCTQAARHLRSALLHGLSASLWAQEPITGDRLADARQYMQARLDDAELTPAQVAQALGLSTRSLARLFAAEGSTPSRWLWSERLAQAHRLLAQGEVGRVTDAALACGFTSFSHFSRAFRQAYGMAPSALLSRA
ncbi:L-rhamnose operon regulatory protein rhaS [Delftia tsuruhatensis]|uniref:AraC family transcriptional regulator n=1 Tax=Delftia tsuruhatensis TaxID=180282 RepID=UPI001E7D6BF7|nr:AraC family transcriptional regulator [Delftia tsuruhatensis]CAB5661108.1 L-rhamnose operon regulatory protein rhaS [Delftia tsuruhatensis]CAC9680024.1 L-rhamnose operon regulatory protein rhaS [Delftia tsuruhatensis]